MPSECDLILQLGLSGGTDEPSSMPDCSCSTETDVNMSYFSSQPSAEDNYPIFLWFKLLMRILPQQRIQMAICATSLLLAPRMDNAYYRENFKEPNEQIPRDVYFLAV